MRFSVAPSYARTVCLTLLITAAVLSVAAASVRLGERIAYELQGPFTADTTIYWAVGRGILNGLLPYQDLFETKPPGIFLLSSLSFLLSGDVGLSGIMQTIVIGLFPIILVVGAFRAHRPIALISEGLIVLVSLAFGMALALYTAERSGEFQTESFGAVFVCAYAAIIAWDPRPLHRGRILFAGIMLLLAIGIKEPFAITALASAILLAQHPRDLIQSFFKPALLAGLAGLAVMAALGYLEPYVQIYLPEMIGKHIAGGEPLWIRGLHLERIIRDVNAYSLLLTASVVSLVAPAVLLRMHSHKSIAGKTAAILSITFALYLLSFAVGMGGSYWNHHFVFAVPGYAALFFLVNREMRRHRSRITTAVFAGLVIAFSTGTNFTHPDIDFQAKLFDIHSGETIVRQQSEAIDTVLDRCGIERYLFIGGNGIQPYAFTRHSPLGPLFFQYEYLLDEQRPAFRQSMTDSFERAFFVVTDGEVFLNTLTEPARTYLGDHFTEEPWACAGGVRGGDRFRFLYRKSGGSVAAKF